MEKVGENRNTKFATTSCLLFIFLYLNLNLNYEKKNSRIDEICGQ